MQPLKKPYTTVQGIEKYFPALYGETTDYQIKRYEYAFEYFKKHFEKDSAYIASSSGRVEVCGNHTDHNGGKVVSCAISLDTLAFFLPTNDDVITVKSEGYDEIVVDINGVENEKKGTSAALVRGVVVALKNKGFKTGGFKAYLTSNVLGGAGISSSASFEVLIAEILNFLYNNSKISAQDKAIVSQYAENVYFGKPCGLLDQTAIAFGGLKKLDFSDEKQIKVTDIQFDLSDYTLVLVNTGGSHADLTDEYASIPFEMKNVAKAFGKQRLCEISKDDFFNTLTSKLDKLSDRSVLRAIHFYEENERVDNLANALSLNDYDRFLSIIRESGISSLCKLQNCYVSGSSDQAIPKALSITANYFVNGANRVHGGGFAGTILNIVKNDEVETFIESISKFYGNNNVIPLKVRKVGTITL